MSPLRQFRKAWRLFQTGSRGDSLLAAVLVAVALLPFIRVWWAMRKGGGSNF